MHAYLDLMKSTTWRVHNTRALSAYEIELIAYARVPTSGQTLDAQLEQLRAHGCDLIFQETMSGARADRPELAKALNALEQGDTLIVSTRRLGITVGLGIANA
jgi:predicted site-specific integrase-resolvase